LDQFLLINAEAAISGAYHLLRTRVTTGVPLLELSQGGRILAPGLAGAIAYCQELTHRIESELSR
jgi:hypothetical protein